MRRARPQRAAALRRGGVALLLAAALVAACDAGSDIEPIPAPQFPPERLLASALSDAKGWVTVVGVPATLPPATRVSLTNVRTAQEARGEAAADGAFSLTVPAAPDDALRLAAAGFAPTELVAALPAAEAPAAPGSLGVPTAAAPVDADGETVVSGPAGAVEPGVRVVVTTPGGGRPAVVDATAEGAFSARIAAAPGATLTLYAWRDGYGSAPAPLRVPTGVDQDRDGYDASIDCDDTTEARSPGAPERCGDGLDDDCDGVIDEGCDVLPCASDADCPAGRVCTDGACEAAAVGDRDGDGVPDDEDGCPDDPDPDQDDSDGDGVGDVCDADADGDGVSPPLDCDDLDPAVGPVAPELCGDGVDNDCDGATDEGC